VPFQIGFIQHQPLGSRKLANERGLADSTRASEHQRFRRRLLIHRSRFFSPARSMNCPQFNPNFDLNWGQFQLEQGNSSRARFLRFRVWVPGRIDRLL